MDIKQVLGLPGILDVRKIVAIQPHPDDNEVGAAGTLMELASRGCQIIFVTVTDGRAGAPDQATVPDRLVTTRMREKQAAGEMIGVSKQIDLGLPDGGGYSVDEVVAKLMPLLRQERPDMVMTVDPWLPYEAHPDHIKTGTAVAQTVLFANNKVLFKDSGHPFSVPQVAFYGTAYPNTFVDVTRHWERKLESILAHASQFRNEEWPMISMYFQYQASELFKQWQQGSPEPANLSDAGFAEAFKVLTPHQLHFFPAAVFS